MARAQFLNNIYDNDLQLILSSQYRLPQDFTTLLHFAENGEHNVQEFRKSLSTMSAAAQAASFEDHPVRTSTSRDEAKKTEARRASSHRGSRGGRRVSSRRHRRGSGQSHSSDHSDDSRRSRSRRRPSSEYAEKSYH